MHSPTLNIMGRSASIIDTIYKLVSHAGTEIAEHIQVIIISAQRVDNVIPPDDRLLSIIPVRVIQNAGNLRMCCPCIFRVRSGPNQSYYTEFYWKRL